jgi:hypothetical protein
MTSAEGTDRSGLGFAAVLTEAGAKINRDWN